MSITMRLFRRAAFFLFLGSFIALTSAERHTPRPGFPQMSGTNRTQAVSISGRALLFDRVLVCDDPGDDICPDERSCCPASQGCCQGTDFCADLDETCCPTGICPSGWNCCGSTHCSPVGGECCSTGDYCDPGFICVLFEGAQACCTDLSCTHFESGGGGTTEFTPPPSSTPPPPESSPTGDGGSSTKSTTEFTPSSSSTLTSSPESSPTGGGSVSLPLISSSPDSTPSTTSSSPTSDSGLGSISDSPSPTVAIPSSAFPGMIAPGKALSYLLVGLLSFFELGLAL